MYWLYFFIGLIPDPETAYDSAEILTYILYSVMSINFITQLAFAFCDIKYKVSLYKLKNKKKVEKEIEEIKQL